MKGTELRAILRANQISQEVFSSKIGVCVETLRNKEASEFVPVKYVNALSELVGRDLLVKSNLETMLEGIPARYFEKKKNKSVSFF